MLQQTPGSRETAATLQHVTPRKAGSLLQGTVPDVCTSLIDSYTSLIDSYTSLTDSSFIVFS